VADFTALAATAKRLIDANGRSITVRKLTDVPTDSAKPWRGASRAVQDSVTGVGVFVSTAPGELGFGVVNEDGLLRGRKVVFFAAADDGGKLLETYNEILDDSTLWRIVDYQILDPGDVRLLYMFMVER